MSRPIHLSTIAWSLYNELCVFHREPTELAELRTALAGKVGEFTEREIRTAARALELLGLVDRTGTSIEVRDPGRRMLVDRDRRMLGRASDGWRNWIIGRPRQPSSFERVTPP